MKAPEFGAASVRVELFGHARIVCGVREIEVSLPSASGASELACALRRALPSLIGVAVEESGGLMPSYTANVNGVSFLGDAPVSLSDGDRVFVFSSQAGG